MKIPTANELENAARGRAMASTDRDARRDAMHALRSKGWTLDQIAAHFDISKQRVWQILGPTGDRDGKRGFAALTPEEHRAIASKGGKSAANRYRFTSERARAAAKISASRRKVHSRSGQVKCEICAPCRCSKAK